MSYAIVKSIQIKNKNTTNPEVWLRAASNNVYPRSYNFWHCESLTKILREKGYDALCVEIVGEYEGGNFQPGVPNKYSKAAERLCRLPDYQMFDWRQPGEAQYEKALLEREKPCFKDLILQAFKTKAAREKFIAKGVNRVGLQELDLYVYRVTKRFIKYTSDSKKAKKFDFKDQAQAIAKQCSKQYDFKVIVV